MAPPQLCHNTLIAQHIFFSFDKHTSKCSKLSSQGPKEKKEWKQLKQFFYPILCQYSLAEREVGSCVSLQSIRYIFTLPYTSNIILQITDYKSEVQKKGAGLLSALCLLIECQPKLLRNKFSMVINLKYNSKWTLTLINILLHVDYVCFWHN